MEKGRFAFGAAREGYTQIYTMDEDGGNVRQLTSGEGRASSSPSLSRDGRRIVFLSNRVPAGEEHHDEGVFIMNCDGTGRTLLTEDSPEYGFGNPRFSADGKRIVFAEYYNDLKCGLGVMNVDGSERKIVLEVPQWTSPVFTMDGQSVLYDCKGQLYRVGLEGGEPKLLFHRREEHHFSRPEVHPDGERIVFRESFRQPSDFFCPHTSSKYRLVEALLEGGDYLPLTRLFQWSYGHAFSPDGSRLAFLGGNLERKYPKGSRVKASRDDRYKEAGTRRHIIRTGEWESVPLRSSPDSLGMMSISWGPMAP